MTISQAERRAAIRVAHEPPWGKERVRHYLPDLVYGANDGIITTFAVVSGVAGAALSPQTAIILGFANLLADGFSMGASNFLSIRSDEAVNELRGEPVQEPFPARHGFATLGAFVLAGSIPLIPFAVAPAATRFPVAVFMTLAALFLIGALRALVTRLHWVRAGSEMLLVGGVAAALSYGVGAFVAGLV